jgi:thiol-disulfide isomerase/thioredoxin
VEEFARGKVYVVEFWATWCGPCIAIMPHVAALQAEYRDRGVTVIGFSARDEGNDPNNKLKTVAAFVKKRGPRLGYTFAYADDRETYDAWMTAAGQGGIPCSFVIDKEGKIAYIGHPMYLDLVLPKVVAGTWNEEAVKSAAAAQQETNGVFRALSGTDPEASLKALADLEAKYPALGKVPYFVHPKMDLLLKMKKYDEARKFAEDVLERAVKQNDEGALRTLSIVLRSPEAKEQKELAELTVKVAEASSTLAGDKTSPRK